MKNYKLINKLNLLFFITVLLFTVSCDTDSLHDLDIPIVGIDDTKLDPGHMFANAALASSTSTGGFNLVQMQSAYVKYIASYSISITGDRYVYDGSNDSEWNIYTNELKHLIHLNELFQEDPEQINNLAMVRILKVYSFHRVTDTYGDIPYTEAGKAFFDGDFFPVYDTQQAIYVDMLKELDEAIGSFNGSLPTFEGNDILFGGDIDKWKKFASSLMLRLAMRVSNVDANLASTYIDKATGYGVLSDNNETVYMRHTDGPSNVNRNDRAQTFIDRDGTKYFKIGEDFMNHIIDTQDPRLMVYSGGVLHEDVVDFSSNDLNTFWYDDSKWDWDPAVQRGHPHGTTIVTIASEYGITTYDQMLKSFSRINPLLIQYNSPQVFIHHSEMKFLLAEASLRGLYGGNAEQLYNEGIWAAMKQYSLFDPSLEVADADIQTYLDAHPFDPGMGEKMIGEQMWLALFQNPQEAWSNWRRTGFPELDTSVEGAQIPVRNKYVQAEVAQNEDNLNAAISKQGTDSFDTKIWWDQ